MDLESIIYDRVLLVDSSPVVALCHGIVLEDEGFAVTVALNAWRALSHLEEKTFEVVVTALASPANGLYLCRRIRQRWPHLPVVVLTGYEDPERRREVLEAGAFDFLIKASEMSDAKHLTLTLKRAIRWSSEKTGADRPWKLTGGVDFQ